MDGVLDGLVSPSPESDVMVWRCTLFEGCSDSSVARWRKKLLLSKANVWQFNSSYEYMKTRRKNKSMRLPLPMAMVSTLSSGIGIGLKYYAFERMKSNFLYIA